MEQGIASLARLLPRVNDVRRKSIPAGELVVATQCGGSDGSSGITANPALGLASDRIVACGGTVILGETTEIAGAEQLLTRRAVSAEVGTEAVGTDPLVALVRRQSLANNWTTTAPWATQPVA